MRYFSTDLVFKFLNGGPADLQYLMLQAGQDAPPLATIRKWKVRKSIPPNWIGAVIWALACKGIDPLLLLEEK